MNRKTAIAAATLTLFGLSACTPQQIADAVASQSASGAEIRPRREPLPTTTTTVAPVADTTELRAIAVAQCDSINFRLLGYPVGTIVIVSIGFEPPYGFKSGIDFEGSGHVNVMQYWQDAGGYNWAVFVQLLDGTETLIGSGQVVC